MPEVKSTKKPAAEKRAAADKSLEERIAARKTKKAEPTESFIAKVEAQNKAQGITPAAEEAPFVADAPKAAKTVKEKKPRVAKRKEEVPAATGVGDIVAKIEARVSARIEKVHTQQTKALVKAHAAEVKQLKAAYKHDSKTMASDLKKLADAAVADAEKKAYAAGLKAGEKAAMKSVTAALKGR